MSLRESPYPSLCGYVAQCFCPILFLKQSTAPLTGGYHKSRRPGNSKRAATAKVVFRPKPVVANRCPIRSEADVQDYPSFSRLPLLVQRLWESNSASLMSGTCDKGKCEPNKAANFNNICNPSDKSNKARTAMGCSQSFPGYYEPKKPKSYS